MRKMPAQMARPSPALRQRFVVFLPSELADEVRGLAAEQDRSLNSQFTVIVRQWLAERNVKDQVAA